MDLVKIGFLIKADGLVKANKEIDALLAKADKLNNLGGGAGGGTGSGSGGKQRNQNKPAKEIDKTTKALEKQKIIGDYVSQGLDKSTATTLANFKQLGASTKDLNKMFAQLGNIKSLEQANKAVKDLAKAQKQAQKDIEKQEKAIESTRQKRLSAEQKEYQKTQEQAKKSIKQQEQQLEASRQKKLSAEQKAYQKTQEDAKKLQQKQQDLANKAQQNADNLRQKTLAAEQKYYQKVQEEARKAAAKQQELSNKNVAAAEAARQKSLASAQKEYQKNMELIQKQQQAQRAAQQKADEAQEKARQKKLSAEQKYYQQQQELVAKAARAQQDSINRQNQQRQNTVKQEETKAKYLGQGFSQTASTKLARMELSGADVATMERYKQALRDTAKAMNDMRPSAAAATEGNNRLLASIRGIAAYALLSTAIYGVITGVAALGKAIVTMSDEYTSIQNRMKLYITDTQELTKVNSQLAVMSMQNNIGLRETSTLFTRLAPAMQKIGANTAAITSVVDSFGKSLRIGGATLMEASSATIQFSQAMASGKLAGDEFRSISEASPRFLKAIADGSGIAADQLKKMSAAGMLTTEVISKALLKEYPKLIEENKKLGITLEQGANSIKTSFQVMFGEFNEGAGITATLGSAMTDMAMGLFETAKSARESGIAFKDWASSIKDEVVVALEIAKFAAISYASYMAATFAVVIGKAIASVVSSFVALGVATRAYYQAAAMGASRFTAALITMRAAVQGVGTAMAAVSLTNWVTLLLTVGGVAAAYLMFRDNAAEANQKLSEQSIYLNKTTEDFKALNAEQLKNAQFKVKVDMEEANKNIEEAKAKYLDYITTVAGFNEKSGLSGYVPDKEGKAAFEALKAAANDGTKSLDSVTTSMLEQGLVSKEYAKEIYAVTRNYDKAATSGLGMSETAKALGINTEVSGNKMQNAAIKAQLLGDGFSDIAEKAKIATNEVGKLVKELNTKLSEAKLSYSIEDSTGLGQKYSTDIAADAVAKAAEKESELNKKNIDALAKLNELRQKGTNLANLATTSNGKVQTDAISQLEKNTEELMKQTTLYNKLKTQSPLVKVDPLTQVDPKAVAVAKELEALDKKRAERDAARNKTDKDGDKDLKRLESIREGYQEQIDYVRRLQGLLQQGLSGDAAKIAAEKDYQDAVIGTQVALDLVEAKRQQSLTEYNLGLEKEESLLQQISLLQDAGASYDQARTLAQSGHLANELAMLALAYQITNEQEAKKLSLIDQARTQGDVNHFLQQGLSLEEATTEAVFARLKAVGMGLSKEQLALKQKIVEQQQLVKTRQTETAYLQDMSKLEKQKQLYVNAQADGYEKLAINMAIANKIAQNPDLSPAQARKLVEAEELNSYEKDLADLKRLTYIATLDESEAVKDIISNYATWDSVQVGIVAKQQKLLEIAKELSEERAKQAKNPIGDFSNVDFNVFGDFGNPFQSALEGLNEFVVKSQESRSAMAALSSEIVSGRIKGLDVSDLEIEKNILLSKQESDRRKNIDKGITTTLSLTKSMFKEESKGYKVVSKLEQVYQASQIAFQMWKNREKIKETALELWGYAKSAASYVATTATKIAAEGGLNIVKGIGAVLTQGTGDPYTAFARMAAMAAIVAGLGVAIASNIGGDSGTVTPANDGTGTVFGDSTAKSESINNSIEILSENSDLMLPLTSAMLRSLRNIESSLGGVANLIIRGDVGNIAGSLTYAEKLTGVIGKAFGVFEKVTNKLEGFGLTNFGLGSSIVGKILGGIFGKTSAEVTGSGLYGGSQSLGNIMDGGFNLSQYADVATTKKSWFSKKTSYSTKYQAVSQEITDQFGLIFTNVYDSILSASSVLGRDENGVIQKLRDSIINIGKIDTKGKTGKEIQEALESVIGQQSDLISKGAVGGLEDFQKVGEGYFETLMRVATGIETASYFTERLNVTTIKYNDIINKQGDVAAEMVRQSVLLVEGNKNINGGFYDLVNTFDGTAEEITDFVFTLRDLQDQLFMTGKSGEYLTSAMILGAGGLDTLSSGLDAYFEMLSPAEQAAELTRRLTNEFAIFGKQLPSDVKAFRNLVSSIDISSEAGQKLYGQILALAPEFNDLQDALSSANSDVNALVKSLRDLAEQARAARGETEQPRNLAYTRSQFESNSILAMQGDTKAAEKLLTLGKDLMGLSKTYSVTGSEYARDLALIQRAATVSADIQEQGLGTSISTTLTPSSGSTTTPTVNTNTTSTDAKLDALRADMITAITAVAKYTQDTANRLERWDYGDRVNVHVDQDALDKPIPVKVV